jgi:IS5 family transposase
MRAGFLHGMVHDRRLMREAQVNIAIRWFAGYRLHEKLPDHSSLTRIRQRWGVRRFERIFERIVLICVEAGLVSGETVHFDATLIRADVSWESLTREHVEKVMEENKDDDSTEGRQSCDARGTGTRRAKAKKRSATDPDATMARTRKDVRLEPSYKQHTAVDDHSGVVVDVKLTTGEVNEGKELLGQIQRVEDNTGLAIRTATADASYSHGANYMELEERGILPVIPPQRRKAGKGTFPACRFKYDAKHDVVKCPAGKLLTRKRRAYGRTGWRYYGGAKQCQGCRLKDRCLSAKARARSIFIGDGHAALVRARRRHQNWDTRAHWAYRRHRWRVEGVHGEEKTQHGLRRAIRRGLDNVAIQAYLTAAAINLKRLAKALRPLLLQIRRPQHLFNALLRVLRASQRRTAGLNVAGIALRCGPI